MHDGGAKHSFVCRDMLLNFLAADISRPSAQDSSSQGDQDGASDTNTDTTKNAAEAERPMARETSSLSTPSAPPLSQRFTDQGQTVSFLSTNNSDMNTLSLPPYTPNQDYQRMPTDSFIGSLPMNWPPPQSSQASSSSRTSGFNFTAVDPTSQAWNGGPQPNTAPQTANNASSNLSYPSFGNFLPVESNSFPMDLSGLGCGLNRDADLDVGGLPDCAFVDDTMSMWTNAPPLFGYANNLYFYACAVLTSVVAS